MNNGDERIARVTALAEDVWGNAADAWAFMTTPHPMLRGKTPVACAATDRGTKQVEQILHALAFGLPV